MYHWFMRRHKGEKGNGEIEWAGGKIKMIHKSTRQIKTTKKVIKDEIENYDKSTLLLHFPTA